MAGPRLPLPSVTGASPHRWVQISRELENFLADLTYTVPEHIETPVAVEHDELPEPSRPSLVPLLVGLGLATGLFIWWRNS